MRNNPLIVRIVRMIFYLILVLLDVNLLIFNLFFQKLLFKLETKH